MANEPIAIALVRHLARAAILEREDIIAISDDLDAAGHEQEAHLVRLALIEGLTSDTGEMNMLRQFIGNSDGGNPAT